MQSTSTIKNSYIEKYNFVKKTYYQNVKLQETIK